MRLKVHIQCIWPSPENNALLGMTTAPIYAGQEALMRRVFGPDVEFRTRFNERSSYYTSCSSMEAYNIVGMLEGLREAERDGYDVAFISCGNYASFPLAGYTKIGGTEVPIVDAFTAGAQMARTLGELHRGFGISTSKQRSFKGVPAELAAEVLAPFRIAS